MSLRVYAYEKCDTCRKALKFLAAKKVAARNRADSRPASDGR